jgi:hypothetical protein
LELRPDGSGSSLHNLYNTQAHVNGSSDTSNFGFISGLDTGASSVMVWPTLLCQVLNASAHCICMRGRMHVWFAVLCSRQLSKMYCCIVWLVFTHAS